MKPFSKFSVILVASIFIMVSLSITRQRMESQARDSLNELIDSMSLMASVACFAKDATLAKETAQSFIRNSYVQRISITGYGQALASAERSPSAPVVELKTGPARKTLTRSLESPFDETETIGSIELTPNWPAIEKAVADSVRHTALMLTLLAGGILGTIAAVVVLRVVRPVKTISDRLHALDAANGEALRKEHGYPVRLVVPGWEGNMWVKWLRRIEVTTAAVESREETSKYTDTMADGSSRKWTWVMDAKSVVTSPSPQSPITHGPGPLVITGLAWSGRGSIERVDVTVDGGKTWKTARLVPNANIKALHRFYLDHVWDGSEMLVQSRAIDSTGYVQPTKTELRDIRGLNSVYHNNCIQTWWVKPTGEAENVEIS